MDARHSRGKWKKKDLPYLFFLLILLSQTDAMPNLTWEGQNNSSQSGSCSDNEYLSKKGFCCDKCPPGFKLRSQCKGMGLRSKCEKCSTGTYQEKTNYFENCFKCYKCKTKYEFEITPCTHLQNAVCGCKKGYYKKMINSDTWSCEPCKKCGDGERLITECAGDMDTVCDCNVLHYSVNRTCVPCSECRENCGFHCSLSLSPNSPRHSVHPIPDSTLPTILIPVSVLCIVLAAIVTVYEVLSKWRKRRSGRQTQSSHLESPDPESHMEKQSLKSTVLPNDVDTVFTSYCVKTKQDMVLPDCIPREIKSHEFIYFVLELVPINRFKELVRRLNISEQDIERAERDNRAFIDAQYQMLRLWCDSSLGGSKSILPQSLMHECIDRLKDMNLNSCAESIENKYCTEAQALTMHVST